MGGGYGDHSEDSGIRTLVGVNRSILCDFTVVIMLPRDI